MNSSNHVLLSISLSFPNIGSVNVKTMEGTLTVCSCRT